MAEQGKGWRWYGRNYEAKTRVRMGQNMDAAAIFLANKIIGSFGSSGTTGGRSGATRQQRATNRSKPWGPPNVDTGHLRRNVGYDIPAGRPLSRRIGTGIGNKESVGYAMWLEFGTRKMLPRPCLRPAIWNNRATLQRIMTRPMR